MSKKFKGKKKSRVLGKIKKLKFRCEKGREDDSAGRRPKWRGRGP